MDACYSIQKNKVELRFSNTDSEIDVGYFDGHVSTWDTIDSYNTAFQKGCFANSLKKRNGNVKLVWNHENGLSGRPLTLIGKVLEIKEDDIGLFVRAKLTLDVNKAKEAYALMKDGAVTTLSFAFYPVNSEMRSDGVQVYTEVDIFEVSPVAFEANNQATINQVRDLFSNVENTMTEEKEKKQPPALEKTLQERASDVANMFKQQLLDDTRESLVRNLEDMLMRIWWDYGAEIIDNESLKIGINEIIDTFKKRYVTAMTETLAIFDDMLATENNEMEFGRSDLLPIQNGIGKQLLNHLVRSKQSISDMAMNSQLTIKEIESLSRGELISNSERLHEINAQLWETHNTEHESQVKHAISHLRSLIRTSEDMALVKEGFELRTVKPVRNEKKELAESLLRDLQQLGNI